MNAPDRHPGPTPVSFAGRTVLVTGACGVTSRTLVRALRRSPWFEHTRLIGTDICDNPYALYEGLYARIYRVPRLDKPDTYRQLIERICRDEGVEAALVVPEPEVLFWAEHPMPVRASLPPPRFARQAISKARVYEHLAGTGLVPAFALVDRADVLAGQYHGGLGERVWLRDVGVGSTSGKGALCVSNAGEAAAWAALNPGTTTFMAAEFLPGRNLACLLLYEAGRLIKLGCYERLEYFMAKTVLSGVTGNICQGRLINDELAVSVSCAAVERLCASTGETMTGLVTVDLRTDAQDVPRVTEINLRQVAAASAFAEVPGANLAEAQLLALWGHADQVGPCAVSFPLRNRLFRDIDGLPVFVPDYEPLAVGDCRDAPASSAHSSHPSLPVHRSVP